MVFYDEKIDEFNYFKANTDQLATGDKSIFKELQEKEFQYPESFLDYVQTVLDEERDRLEKPNQEPLAENIQENESETIVIQASEPEINPDNAAQDTSHFAMNIPPDKTILETYTHDTSV